MNENTTYPVVIGRPGQGYFIGVDHAGGPDKTVTRIVIMDGPAKGSTLFLRETKDTRWASGIQGPRTSHVLTDWPLGPTRSERRRRSRQARRARVDRRGWA
jgi:hypothetical protein